MITDAFVEGVLMLVIDDLDEAAVERAGALVACEHGAARQVRPELPAGFRGCRDALAVLAAIAAVAASVVAFALPGRSPGRAFPRSSGSGHRPSGRTSPLPDGTAVLSYPSSLRPVSGDTDAVCAAQVSPAEVFRLYLAATPRQGDEWPRGWAAFRLRLLTADDAASARELAAAG